MPEVKDWKDKNYVRANIFHQVALNETTIPKVAKEVGLSKNALYQQMATPSMLRLGTLEKLAKVFKCRIEDIIYPNKNKPEKEDKIYRVLQELLTKSLVS